MLALAYGLIAMSKCPQRIKVKNTTYITLEFIYDAFWSWICLGFQFNYFFLSLNSKSDKKYLLAKKSGNLVDHKMLIPM